MFSLTFLTPIISVCVHDLSAFGTVSIANSTTIKWKARSDVIIAPDRLQDNINVIYILSVNIMSMLKDLVNW